MAAVPATGAAAEADANKDGVITEAEVGIWLAGSLAFGERGILGLTQR